MSEKQKSGTIRLLTWPDSVLAAPEYMLGALTPEVPGKPCQAAITCIQEIISNSMDVIAENPKSKTLVVDIENYPGYVFVADDSWGIPIEMSPDVPDTTQAKLSISSLHSGSKFSGRGESSGASIGRHGVGSSAVAACSEHYILMSKITEQNYDKSIPAVRKLWEESGPRSKKDLFYIVVYQDCGKLLYEGAIKLADLNKLLPKELRDCRFPSGMSTMVMYKLSDKVFGDRKTEIPVSNLNYFLLIQKEFYKRSIDVWSNGSKLVPQDRVNYRYKIIKTFAPKDTSKNKDLSVLIYFDVDPEMGQKECFGSVNGLSVEEGVHINYIQTAFESALKDYFKIGHKYLTTGLRMCAILLAEGIGFDSQTKTRLKTITKVTASDFVNNLARDFQKAFKSDPETWELHVDRLNTIYESMRSFSAVDKAKKMIDSGRGNSMYRSKIDLVDGFAEATSGKRWDCELFLCEGLSAAGSLKGGRKDTLYHAVMPLRGKVLNVSDKSAEQVLGNKEFATIFKAIGLGIDQYNVTSECKTAEEAYEAIKKHARYGKICISTDEDPDGSAIMNGLLYAFSKFARFLIDFGMVYKVESPFYKQNGKYFYASDPKQANGFPVGLDPTKHFSRYKGLGGLDKEDVYDAFYNPGTRRLIRVTSEGIDYSKALVEDISERKKLLFDSGILSNPYGFKDL